MPKKRRKLDCDEESAEMERLEVEDKERAVARMAPELEVALTTAWRLLVSLPNSHDWGHRKQELDRVEAVVNKLHEVRGH